MWRPFKRKPKRQYGQLPSISSGSVDVLEAVSWIAYLILEVADD